MLDVIRKNILESIETKQKVLELAPQIKESAEIIIDALTQGKKILVCGNGGSAADAQHFAAELVGRFEKERQPLPSITLNTNVSTLTAIGNDYGYDELFARQVEAFGQEGDVLVGISTSGNSPNVLKAIYKAVEKKMSIITLGGKDGGAMKQTLAEQSSSGHHKGEKVTHIIVPSNTTSRIQESHIMIIHIWCKLIDEAFENVN